MTNNLKNKFRKLKKSNKSCKNAFTEIVIQPFLTPTK